MSYLGSVEFRNATVLLTELRKKTICSVTLLFLCYSEFSQALLRLTRMIRGIGDPLVAAYAHCYLCRVGMAVTTGDREYIKENFYDFLASYNQVSCSQCLCMFHSMMAARDIKKSV